MALVDEELKLVASVTDRATSDLDDIAEDLDQIGGLAESVFPIDADVDTDAVDFGELEGLEQQLNDLDDTYTANVRVRRDRTGRALDDLDRAFGLGDEPVGGEDLETAMFDIDMAEMDIAAAEIDRGVGTGGAPTPGYGGGGADDGLRTGGGRMDIATSDEINRVFRQGLDLGDEGDLDVGAINTDAIGATRGRIRVAGDLLPDDAVDEDALGRALVRGDIAPKTAMRAFDPNFADDFQDSLKAMSEIEGQGLIDTPSRRGPLGRTLRRLGDMGPDIRQLHEMFASIVPLLAVFIGALPAAIGGLMALAAAAVAAAGALGAVGGLAIYGAGMGPGGFSLQNLREEIDAIKQSFHEAFAPIADDLAPIVDTAVAAVQTLFQGLAGNSQVFRDLRDEVENLVQMLGQELVGAITTMLRGAEAAIPLMTEMARIALNSGIFTGLMQFLGEILPDLWMLGQALMSLIPYVIELSQGFLLAVTGIAYFLNVFFALLDIIPFGTKAFGALIATLLTLITVSKMAAVVNEALAWTFGESMLSSLHAAIAGYFEYISATYASTLATITLTAAVATLIGMLTLGLGPVLGAISGQFAGMNSEIERATKNLKNFGRHKRGLGSLGGVGNGRGQYNVNIEDNSQTIVRADSADHSKAADIQNYTQGQQYDNIIFK